MKPQVVTDITKRSNEVAIALLCTFNEAVRTPSGVIAWSEADKKFVLTPTEGKARPFQTASGAVEVLRRLSK